MLLLSSDFFKINLFKKKKNCSVTLSDILCQMVWIQIEQTSVGPDLGPNLCKKSLLALGKSLQIPVLYIQWSLYFSTHLIC